ncbi:MAG: peptidylprolyl isomerase [Lewinella sp.]|nr:peptidylprolyl isomerase [Lewinella sp.]
MSRNNRRMSYPTSTYWFLALATLLLASCSRPVANFVLPEEPAVIKPLTFENQSEKAQRYLWQFGDGQTSEEASPTHHYYASGEYTVRLTAYDEQGRTRTRERHIRIHAPEKCLVLIETPYGNMVAEIFDSTPAHQDNFVKLIEQQYYDSLLFHRVINGFMLQGGDPNSRNAPPDQNLGFGGPGYTLPAEFVDTLAHTKGALAAARTENPQKRSSGSQFYIVQGRPVTGDDLTRTEGQGGFRYPSSVRDRYLEVGGTPFLDQSYTVFGRIIEGMEVIDRIASVPTNSSNRPQEDVWMILRLIR